MNYKITNANIKEWAKNYDGPQFDGILCDPPYELGFMGKSWDSSGIAFDQEMWADLFRHIKPGGHLLAFSGSRTYHRMAVAIEDAGFEIRDMIEWIYGQGFPKALNINKQLNTCNCSGNAVPYIHDSELRQLPERDEKEPISTNEEQGEVLQSGVSEQISHRPVQGQESNKGLETREESSVEGRKLYRTRQGLQDATDARTPKSETERLRTGTYSDNGTDDRQTTTGRGRSTSPEQTEGGQPTRELETIREPHYTLDGESLPRCSRCKNPILQSEYKTALKPAHEPCVLARKPLDKGMTVANNVLTHGTGGLNIDGTRVGTFSNTQPSGVTRLGQWASSHDGANRKILPETVEVKQGRFPANLIHDGSDEVEAVFPQNIKGQYGGRGRAANSKSGKYGWNNVKEEVNNKGATQGTADSGSASRFFYKVEYDNNSYDDTLKHAIMNVCKNTNVNSVVGFLRTIQATTESTAQWSATQSQRELLDQNVKSVANLSQECVTSIVQELVRIKSLVSNQQELTAFQHFTKNYKNDTRIQNLALIVEKWVNTDTIPTTTSLMKLFGCVLLATDENTKQENQENSNDTFRLIYTAKASKSERNAGLEDMPLIHPGEVTGGKPGSAGAKNGGYAGMTETPRQNVHPTVKPLSLTKYLATLIKPPTGGRLLVPFSGSGSEMIGALQAGWEYVEGVELTEEYIPIAEARIKYWLELKEAEVQQMELV